jgi:hypothetical protein
LQPHHDHTEMQAESRHFSLKTQFQLAYPDMKKGDTENIEVLESYLSSGNNQVSFTHEELIEKEKECLKFILQQVLLHMLCFWLSSQCFLD